MTSYNIDRHTLIRHIEVKHIRNILCIILYNKDSI